MIFHTDLDNTLIYSGRHDIGKGLYCVEIYQNREISFITKETRRLLREVKERVTVVPTTTRTVEQYERIDLGVGTFKYALVCNGGVLLVDGKEEEQWYRESLELVKDSSAEMLRALELLEKDRRRSFELRFIKNLFLFTKSEEPEAVTKSLRGALDKDAVEVLNNGSKVYVLPRALSKGKAVERFRDYIGARGVIAAGDSAFDVSMLETADFGIAAPELVRLYDFPDKIKCPPAGKVFAESVLETVLHISADGRL